MLVTDIMYNFKSAIPELPNIAIDSFEIPDNAGNLSPTIYFLSHCHADHMQGINTKFVYFLKKNPGIFIYCSPISRLILMNLHLGFEASHIKELTDSMYIEIPENNITGSVSYSLVVTPISSGHCPGSIMFLFETATNVILCTGDFRIVKGDIQKFVKLQKYCNGSKIIDKIYFDATFLNEDYWEFPLRSECLRDVVELIKIWLKECPEMNVIIETSAKYGYEHLMVGLAKEFHCKIHVNENYFLSFSNIPSIGQILTNNSRETKFHFCHKNENIAVSEPIGKIKLSAKKFKWKKGICRPDMIIKAGERIAHLCYATHSSCSEIIDFLEYLQPMFMEACTSTVDRSEEEVESYIHKLRSTWINYDEFRSDSLMKRKFKF